MRYAVEGYSQEKLVELGLDAVDAVLLRWFSDFYSGSMQKWRPNREGPVYGWVSYSKVIAELPCLGLTRPDSVGKRFKKLRLAGVLFGKLRRDETGTTMWLAPNPDVYDALTRIEIRTPTGSKSGPLPDENRVNSSSKYSSISDNGDGGFYNRLKSAFLSKQPDRRFANYGREGKAIKSMIDEAKKRRPEDPEGWVRETVGAFIDLKRGRDSFWNKQPVLPSVIMAGGILPRVLDHVETSKGNSAVAEDMAAVAEEIRW